MIAFVHMFKTAGTTMTGILRRNFSYHHFDTRIIQEKPALTAAQLRKAQRFYPRMESIAGHAVRTTSNLREGFPDIRFYTFVREPARRLVSAYIFSRSKAISDDQWKPVSNAVDIEADFESFTKIFKQGYCQILGAEPTRPDVAIEALDREIEFVGLVEKFDESLALFRNWLGRPGFDPTYQRLNVYAARQVGEGSTQDPTQAAVDAFINAARPVMKSPPVTALVEEVSAPDQVVYRHVIDEVWPRLQRRYGAGPGPFNFERDRAATDTLANRLVRDLIGRPFAGPLAR